MSFLAYRVEEADKKFEASWVEQEDADLPEGDVLIEVAYSSVNYKDASQKPIRTHRVLMPQVLFLKAVIARSRRVTRLSYSVTTWA